jgi:hypothetical protein
LGKYHDKRAVDFLYAINRRAKEVLEIIHSIQSFCIRKVFEENGPWEKSIVGKVFKWWMKHKRIHSIDVAVECGNKAVVAHAKFMEILIDFEFAAKTI